MIVYVNKIFDAHVHFRQGPMQIIAADEIVKHCFAAVAMGNTDPPYSGANICERRREIRHSAVQCGNTLFEPLMTCMLTRGFSYGDIRLAHQSGARIIKLIPGDTSTGSAGMVPLAELKDYYGVLEYAARQGFIFSLHAELSRHPASGEAIPELEQEESAIYFVDQLIKNVPELPVVIEHISTGALLGYVLSGPGKVVGTVTTHHLFGHYGMVCDRQGAIIHPENYCKPILKSMNDMFALQDAVLGGSNKLFFGSDFAPHPPHTKDPARLKRMKPNAGIVCPHETAIILIWTLFASRFGAGREAKERFNRFMSGAGSVFYGLTPSAELIRLAEKPSIAQKAINGIPAFWGGKELKWTIEN